MASVSRACRNRVTPPTEAWPHQTNVYSTPSYHQRLSSHSTSICDDGHRILRRFSLSYVTVLQRDLRRLGCLFFPGLVHLACRGTMVWTTNLGASRPGKGDGGRLQLQLVYLGVAVINDMI